MALASRSTRHSRTEGLYASPPSSLLGTAPFGHSPNKRYVARKGSRAGVALRSGFLCYSNSLTSKCARESLIRLPLFCRLASFLCPDARPRCAGTHQLVQQLPPVRSQGTPCFSEESAQRGKHESAASVESDCVESGPLIVSQVISLELVARGADIMFHTFLLIPPYTRRFVLLTGLLPCRLWEEVVRMSTKLRQV